MKKSKIIGIGLIAIFVLSLSWYLIDRFSYSKELPYYELNNSNQDKILTIGIIGDSWVAGNKLDSLLHADLLEHGLNNNIISSGHSGAKTKLIYQNLFKSAAEEHSSKFIIEKRPDFCIVIAGVNDAASEIGSHFYSYHMIQIVKTLLHYKIKPVIVSLPEFGIKESIDNMNIVSKNRNVISAYFNNNGEIDNIRTYRNVFVEELKSNKLQDSIILIDFDKICSDYNKHPELYANSAHLSIKGYEILGQIITNELTIKYKSANNIGY